MNEASDSSRSVASQKSQKSQQSKRSAPSRNSAKKSPRGSLALPNILPPKRKSNNSNSLEPRKSKTLKANLSDDGSKRRGE